MLWGDVCSITDLRIEYHPTLKTLCAKDEDGVNKSRAALATSAMGGVFIGKEGDMPLKPPKYVDTVRNLIY